MIQLGLFSLLTLLTTMDSSPTDHGRMAVDHHTGRDDDVLVETAGDAGLADKVVWRIERSQGALVSVVRYLLAERRKEARRYSAMSTLSTLSTMSTMSALSSVSSGSTEAASISGTSATSNPRSLGINSAAPRPTSRPHSGPSFDAPSSSESLSPPFDRRPKPDRVAFSTLNQLLSASLHKRKRPETHYEGIPISVILSNPHFPCESSSPSSFSSSSSISSPAGRRGDRRETRQIASPRRVGLARMLDSLAVGEREDGYGGEEGDHRMIESDGDRSSEEDDEDDEDDLVIIV